MGMKGWEGKGAVGAKGWHASCGPCVWGRVRGRALGVEGGLGEVGEELLEEAPLVDAHLLRPKPVHKRHAHPPLRGHHRRVCHRSTSASTTLCLHSIAARLPLPPKTSRP